MRDMASVGKSLCYCTKLRRSAGALSAFYDSALATSGLTVPQYYLLINLSRMGSANISQWALRVGLDRTTMVRNMKPLEAAQLVERVSGRGKCFALSALGEARLETAIPLWQQAQKQIEAFLGAEDAAAILRICGRLEGLSPSG